MSESKTFTRLVRVNIIDTMNDVIVYLSKKIEAGEEIPRELQAVDIRMEIVQAHLIAIAKRALILGDPEINERLLSIGILKAETEEVPEPKGNA